jgi:glycosyltransferase involved in cell wall biosynthesis
MLAPAYTPCRGTIERTYRVLTGTLWRGDDRAPPPATTPAQAVPPGVTATAPVATSPAAPVDGSADARLPLVSAVIPSYNYGHFLVEAVRSALAQTYPRMEVIVVDDGSTDDTRRRLGPYMGRIRYVYQENQGLAAARNTGIRLARGEWIALLDSDDVWHPQKTELQLRAAAGVNGVGLIGTRETCDLPVPQRLEPNPPVTHLSVRDFLLLTPVAPSSVLIRRDCLDAVGMFDTSLGPAADRDLWLRLAARFPCVQVHSACYHYRRHTGQMSRQAVVMYQDCRRVLEKFFGEHPGEAGLRNLAFSYLYLDTAMSHLAAGDRATALWFLLRSMCRRPLPFHDRQPQSRWWRPKLLVRLVLGESLFYKLRDLRSGGRACSPYGLAGP